MIDIAPNLIYEIVIWLFLLYSLAVLLIYSWIGIYAYGAVIKYKNENKFTDYNLIVTNKNAPKFSLIAPAYNEGMTIVDNVRSLLSLYYHNLEIIIVNDGSKDDSIEKLIAVYDLEKVSFFIQGNIETKAVKGVYKSKNAAFKKLLVVDKENGGKADALNVGVNISSGQYIVCIDVDCILEQDALLKLAKPFLEQSEKRVIACGGIIRLANNCQIDNGKVTDINLPKTWLGRTQALEYIRAFVLGRMAWSRASGLILISGAFGAFDKEIVLACGGYDKNTVGEDMELVVRMRRYMEENKQPYEVVNIPDPLCWTEAPESKTVLKKQRNRWMRGTMETLWKHRSLMFNPKYGKLGMVSMPYWFFFEFLGPLVEFLGYIVFFIFLFLGIINWSFFIALFALVIFSGILYSIYAILVDLLGYQVYTKRKDLNTLIITAILEPFYFHPIVVKAGVQGAIDYFKNQHSWGEMTRQGFQQGSKDDPWYKQIAFYLAQVIQTFTPNALLFFVLYLFTVAAETWCYNNTFAQIADTAIGIPLLVDNIFIALKMILVIGVVYTLLSIISEFVAATVMKLSFGLIILTQFILFFYFSESRNLLGADIFYYSMEELKQILDSSGVLSVTNISLVLVLIISLTSVFWFIDRLRIKIISPTICIFILGLISFFIPSDFAQSIIHVKQQDEFVQNIQNSKWEYFIESNIDNYLDEHPKIAQYFNGTTNEDIIITNTDFPFLHEENTVDFLGQYLNKANKTPNLVFIIVEGLGAAYSSPKGYIGNFTPFIDSLAKKSLSWSNNLSSSGRTFGVLSSILGSLPFGENGFLEEKTQIDHFNLYNIFNKNGFETGFFYGGKSEFDKMNAFLKFSGVNHIVDENSYGPKYKKLPAFAGESWGYEDQALFSKYLNDQNITSKPYFNVLLTLSTHNPFLINNEQFYQNMFDKRLLQNDLNASNKKWAKENRKQLVSVMNLDHALASFFKEYQKRSDFANTIFIITGDHAMPEIPLQTKIDRYHVPLILYSPLLKTPKQFSNIVTHFDLAPSILAYYHNNYAIKTPSQVTWVGKGLDKGIAQNGIAIMQSKNQLDDFVYGNYHVSDKNIYKLNKDLEEDLVQDQTIKKDLSIRFETWKKKNEIFSAKQQLIPDSIYKAYFK